MHALLTVAADGLAARQWRDMGARTQEEARSFIVSSLRRRLGLVICREFARHRIRRMPYIGVPRAVVERRMQRGQLVGGPQARVPLYVPYADFFQYQAGPGRLADRDRPRVSARGRRACRKARTRSAGPIDGSTAF